MINISSNNIITITRGDDISFTFEVNKGSNICRDYHEFKDSDYVYVGIMEPNQCFENALIRKKLTINDLLQDGKTMKVSIKGSDTEHLLPGVYYYQIKLFESDSAKVTTIRNKTKFIIID